jgi:hypothetical protein
MSRDEPDASESEDDALDDALDDPDLLGDDFEPVPDELDDELGAADLDDQIDDDDDGLAEDETASSNDDSGPSREVPAGVRPSDDEDDDDDDEELEADLGEILKERLASEDEDEDDEDDEIGMVTGSRSASKQEDEILCEGCFLLVKPSQFDTRAPEPSCPHCGTPIAY